MGGRSDSLQKEGEPLRVAWISDYPVEWMQHVPEPLRHLRQQHPATWAMVLLQELQQHTEVSLDVIVLRGRIRESVTFEQNGVTYHILKASPAGRVLSLYWLDTLLIWNRLKRVKPDLVHAWGTERAAALVASRLGQPYLVTLQGLLSWIVSAVPSSHPFLKFMAKLEPMAMRRARVTTCESRFSAAYLEERYPDLRVLQMEHAPSRAFRDVMRVNEHESLRLLAVGTIGTGKGSDLLLKALDKLRSEFRFMLILVGDCLPGFIATMRSQTSSNLWERVEIKPRLTQVEVADELSRATLLAHPTRVDNSPNSVKEAAVAGVPVVASNVGGIPDYITHGKNGLLFPPGNQSALTRSLREALTHPQFGKGQVDQQTLNNVRGYLSPERMAQNFLLAYRETLDTWTEPGGHPWKPSLAKPSKQGIAPILTR